MHWGGCSQVLLPQPNFLGKKQHVIARPERSFSPASSKKGTALPLPLPLLPVFGVNSCPASWGLSGKSVRGAGLGNPSGRKPTLSGKKVLLGLGRPSLVLRAAGPATSHGRGNPAARQKSLKMVCPTRLSNATPPVGRAPWVLSGHRLRASAAPSSQGKAAGRALRREDKQVPSAPGTLMTWH